MAALMVARRKSEPPKAAVRWTVPAATPRPQTVAPPQRRDETPPDYRQPIQLVEVTAHKGRKAMFDLADEAANLAGHLNGALDLADEAGKLADRINSAIEQLRRLQVASDQTAVGLASLREEMPRRTDTLGERIDGQRNELLGRLSAAEAAWQAEVRKLQDAMGPIEQRFSTLQAGLAQQLDPVRSLAAQAMSRAEHAINETGKAMARELPSPTLPDFIDRVEIDGDQLIEVRQSGARRTAGRFPRKAGGGRASSAERYNLYTKVVTVGADHTIHVGELTRIVLLVTAAATVTLPDAAKSRDRICEIKRTGSGAVVIAAQGVQTIDGLASIDLDTIYDAVEVISDGANWFIL